MGLDMYLEGRKFFWSPRAVDEEGFAVSNVTVELGYWRKHPNLHGFIVQTFAEGKDECQEIELDLDDLERIVIAVRENKLPKTTGFFFGDSDGSEKEGDLEILSKAIAWLSGLGDAKAGPMRTVVYKASW